MSKTYKKSGSELEWLRGEVKRLKKLVRQLQKSAHVYNNIKDLVEDPPDQEDDEKLICNECGKGEIKILDLGNKQVITCTICDHRKVLNGKDKKAL